MKWVDMEHLKRIDVPDEGHSNPSPEPTLTTETTAKETDGTNKEGSSDRHLYPCLAKYGLLDIIDEIARKKELQSSLNVMRKAKRKKVDELARFASGRKTEEDSLVTGINNIFQAYHIFRAQYHGGDLAVGHLSHL